MRPSLLWMASAVLPGPFRVMSVCPNVTAPPPPVVSEIVLHPMLVKSMVSPLTAFCAAKRRLPVVPLPVFASLQVFTVHVVGVAIAAAGAARHRAVAKQAAIGLRRANTREVESNMELSPEIGLLAPTSV